MKTEENVFEIYVKELCKYCLNKDNKKDLCEIRRLINGTIKCINYKKG